MRYILSLLIFFLLVGPVVAQNEQDQVIFKAMQDELQRNKAELALPGMDKPFYLSFSLTSLVPDEDQGAASLKLSGSWERSRIHWNCRGEG